MDLETEAAAGGLARWAPSVMPPDGPALDRRQAMAAAFRVLAAEGFSENMAGHITWMEPDGESMLVNPWGLWWDEITAADVCRVDLEAKVVEGRWDVTPAIHIHTELHRTRDDAEVVVHNHPYWATVLAALGVLPDVFHQTGCLFDGDLGFVREYDGEVDDPRKGADLAAEIGDNAVTLLANHGVIVTGRSVPEAVYRAASFDRQCKLAYHVLLADGDPSVIAPQARAGMKASLIERAADVYWSGWIRRLRRDAPETFTSAPHGT